MRVLRYIQTAILVVIGTQFFGQSKIIDKEFLFKDSLLGSKQSIFIDYDKGNKYYNRISNFSFDSFDKQIYNSSINYYKDNNIALTKRQVNGIAKKWITLKQYKENFYVYHPCDFIAHYRVAINDTTFVDWTGEGPVAIKIIDFKRIDNKIFEFTLSGVYDQDHKLKIHIIDNKNGIAIFEKVLADGESIRYLMIDADKIRNLPIIVNKCEVHKQSELKFGEPDYDKLLKMNK
jgi:hypothetical protein